ESFHDLELRDEPDGKPRGGLSEQRAVDQLAFEAADRKSRKKSAKLFEIGFVREFSQRELGPAARGRLRRRVTRGARVNMKAHVRLPGGLDQHLRELSRAQYAE